MAAHGGALLLTSGDRLPPETAARAGDAIYAVGAAAAQAVPDALHALVGTTPAETSVLVASELFAGPSAVGIATADAFPDALAGGPHARPSGPRSFSPPPRRWTPASTSTCAARPRSPRPGSSAAQPHFPPRSRNPSTKPCSADLAGRPMHPARWLAAVVAGRYWCDAPPPAVCRWLAAVVVQRYCSTHPQAWWLTPWWPCRRVATTVIAVVGPEAGVCAAALGAGPTCARWSRTPRARPWTGGLRDTGGGAARAHPVAGARRRPVGGGVADEALGRHLRPAGRRGALEVEVAAAVARWRRGRWSCPTTTSSSTRSRGRRRGGTSTSASCTRAAPHRVVPTTPAAAATAIAHLHAGRWWPDLDRLLADVDQVVPDRVGTSRRCPRRPARALRHGWWGRLSLRVATISWKAHSDARVAAPAVTAGAPVVPRRRSW